MQPAVESALTAAFPERAVERVTEPSGSAHPGNATVEVAFADGDGAFLKVAVDSRGERVAREAAATRYTAAHCDVRVPEVFVADPVHDPPYVAIAPLSGTTVADRWTDATAAERTDLLRAVGRALAGVHAARFDRPGRVQDGDATSLTLDPGSWTDVLCATVEERAEALFAERFADLPGRVTRILREHRNRLDGAPAALLHGDPRAENCLLGSAGSGLLDWETALVGDPALDLCRAESQHVENSGVGDDERLRAALHDGYCEHSGSLPAGFDARRPLYRVVTHLARARTFDLWAPDADEPTDDLAAWVRDELDRRIDALPAADRTS